MLPHLLMHLQKFPHGNLLKYISMLYDVNLRDVYIKNKIPLRNGTIIVPCVPIPYQYRSILFSGFLSRERCLVGTSTYSEFLQIPTKYQPCTYPVPDQYILRFLNTEF